MKIKFTDKITKDKWIEYYNSLDEISDEIKKGCKIVFLLDCQICKKEIETKNAKYALSGICKKCKKESVKC